MEVSSRGFCTWFSSVSLVILRVIKTNLAATSLLQTHHLMFTVVSLLRDTVIPRLTKIIRSGITFVSRNVSISLFTELLWEHKQASRVGGSPLCDVVSPFLCHTHTDGKDKLLGWPDRSCLLLYVSARIH